MVAFGHVGDGNVHLNVSQPRDWPAERFLAESEALTAVVYDLVAAFVRIVASRKRRRLR